jgi:methyltransferase family protein
MVAFNDFVLSQLPAPPGRVLELGCGDRGGVVLELEAAGYDPLGIDPHAPEGPRFRRIALDELDDDGPFVAVVASRVLHHVEPLAPALTKLAGLAPLIVVDDFGPERVDDDAQEWYEGQHRALRLAGQEPTGPARLDEWRTHHPKLHPSHVVLEALRERYDETFFEWRPYLYRWLGGFATEQLEETLVATDAIPAIGFRFVGTATER